MSLLTNVVGSLTGSIDKALLCVRKPVAPTAAGSGGNGRTNVDLRAALAANTSPKNLVSSFTSVQTTANTAGYHVIQVKYNPSKIEMISSGGSFMEPGVGGAGTNTLQQITQPTQILMRVELVFDDENHADAFMWEKFTNITAGALVSDVAAVAKIAQGKRYSVQAQIEGMIALLSQSETRQAVFYWSDIAFAGEVTSVEAKYTMFNPAGDPVRGTVTLMLQQGGEDREAGTQWDKAFDDLFQTAAVKGGSLTDSIGNIVNLR